MKGREILCGMAEGGMAEGGMAEGGMAEDGRLVYHGCC
jgi:hypothetical protein